MLASTDQGAASFAGHQSQAKVVGGMGRIPGIFDQAALPGNGNRGQILQGRLLQEPDQIAALAQLGAVDQGAEPPPIAAVAPPPQTPPPPPPPPPAPPPPPTDKR